MTNLYEKLSWLPQPPENFSKIILNASNAGDLRYLAGYDLDENQLNRLYKRLKTFQSEGSDLSPLVSLNVGILSNATTNLIVPSLVGTALRYGIALNVVEAEFNQVAQESHSKKSIFFGKEIKTILVAIDYHGLPLRPSPGDEISGNQNIRECFEYIRSVVCSLQSKTGARIIIQNIAHPPEYLFGSYERLLVGTIAWIISRINIKLDSLASETVCILDVAGLAANIGLFNWHNPTQWNIAKLPFSQKYMPIYVEYVCRILAAGLGRSRRCLVLDLDNTLWGGIIGDDGLEGILIGHGNPSAEAHLNLQQVAIDLRERGVVLAVSSKNDDEIARLPFKKHPDMLLREDHIAVFQANWTDKASNIRAISQTLSLGLDSIVFLDDNPAERMQVRRELPEVAVPELPDDPSLYSRVLIAGGYFEAIIFSDEDRKRASFYQDNSKRAQILNNSSDIEAYLISLDMEISFNPFDLIGLPRITQLISKSNQFNLTTKRYSELELKKIMLDKNFYTSQIRLKDILGDNGMISVIICKKEKYVWEIDTWLMSCRVLGRRVEIAALQNIVEQAKDAGASKLIGTYIPTPRNILVKDHYKNLGFVRSMTKEKVETWELDINQFQIKSLPFKLQVK